MSRLLHPASFVVLVDESLTKAAGPFIGPKGGKWADPAHTIAWKPRHEGDEPKVHRKQLLRGNLGIPRIDMPQIPSKALPAFITALQTKGIGVHGEVVPVTSLRATQSELHKDKIKAEIKRGDLAHTNKPVIVSSDGYLLDGHHRWAALHTMSPGNKINVIRIGLPIRDLLREAATFDGVEHKKSATEEAIDLLKSNPFGIVFPNPQASGSGYADEMKRARKKKDKKKGLATHRASAQFLEVLTSLPPTTSTEPQPIDVTHAGDSRKSAAEAREHSLFLLHTVQERRRENPPPVDHMRAMRQKVGS